MRKIFLSLLFLLVLALPGCGQNIAVPGHVVDYQNLEANPLTDAGACADSGGCGSTIPHGTFTSKYDGNLTIAFNPAAPYDDLYLYQNLNRSSFTFNAPLQEYFDITFSVSDQTRCQAFELDPQLVQAGEVYNSGIQFLTQRGGGPAVRHFDYATKHWNTLAGIPLPDLTKPVRVQVAQTLNPVNHTITLVSVTINGVWYGVGITTNSVPTYSSTAFGLSAAFQLDSDSTADPYSATITDWRVVIDKQ